jgi:signal transduction histidine kinase
MSSRLLAFKNSFIAKLLLILVLFMIGMAIVFDFALINLQKKTFHTAYNAHGRTMVHMLANTIRLAVFVENEEDLLIPVQGMMGQDDVVEVAVFGKDKQLLCQETKNPGGPLHILPNAKATHEDLNTLTKMETLNRQTNDVLIYWHQVSFSSAPDTAEDWYFDAEMVAPVQEVVGYVALVLSKKALKHGQQQILLQTGITVLIFLAIGILATLIIIQRVTEPLRSLLQFIRKSTDNTTGSNDLALLTETYGSIIEDLEQSFMTIATFNDELEEKVLQRTRKLAQANETLSAREEKLALSNANLSQTLIRLQDTQEQLIQQEKLASIGQLVAGVAHEVNNTINFVSVALPSLHNCLAELRTVMTSYEEVEQAQGTDSLADKIAALREIKEELTFAELFSTIDQLMENIDEGIRRTTTIINDLNTYSRKDTTKPCSIDLNEAIDAVLHRVDSQKMSQIEVIRDYTLLPPVQCLPDRLNQVFVNLIHNGIDAIDGAGQLIFTTQPRAKHVHLFFSDTGHGIEEKDRHKIFDPFYTRKEVGKGTGLGLSISYAIIKQHGGDIKVHSEVGIGTIIEVILPIKGTGLPQDAS